MMGAEGNNVVTLALTDRVQNTATRPRGGHPLRSVPTVHLANPHHLDSTSSLPFTICAALRR